MSKYKDVLFDPDFWSTGIVNRRFREAETVIVIVLSINYVC